VVEELSDEEGWSPATDLRWWVEGRRVSDAGRIVLLGLFEGECLLVFRSRIGDEFVLWMGGIEFWRRGAFKPKVSAKALSVRSMANA
jgi:hypothetical protein